MLIKRLLAGYTRALETDDAMASGQTPDSDRWAAVEQRIARLTSVVERQEQTEQQRQHTMQRQQALAQVATAVNTAQQQVDAARTKLANAYDTGDSAQIAAATAELSAATARHTAEQIRFDSAQRQSQAESRPQEPARADDTNLRGWRSRNESWYGIDPDMTRAAHEIDGQLRSEGVLEVGSAAYFNAIDARMRAKFPDRMTAAAPAASRHTTQRGGAAMPNTTPQGARIPAAVAESYRRMGINVDDPKVAASLVDARKVAVAKGLLPETPVSERIITR